MNPTTNGQALADETELPPGYASWADVPDSLIPVTVVEGGARSASSRLGFVKGPLRLDWLAAVADSGHSKALLVALAIKAQADRRHETWVTPPPGVLNDFGVSRVDRSRSIAALEKAGLLEVQRRAGRPPLVRLVPWKGGAGGRSRVSA